MRHQQATLPISVEMYASDTEGPSGCLHQFTPCVLCIRLLPVFSVYLATLFFWGKDWSHVHNRNSPSLLPLLDSPHLAGAGSLCGGVTQTSSLRGVSSGHHAIYHLHLVRLLSK